MAWLSLLIICFFFKQETAYEMRISDWSSDVCSSDLTLDREAGPAAAARGRVGIFDLERRSAERIDEIDDAAAHQIDADRVDDELHPVGFREDRKSVV